MGIEFGGVGLQLESRKNRIYVVMPVRNGPGDRAGIRGGDEIIGIDGDKLDKPDIDSVVKKLRGKPGTKVAASLFRASEDREFSVTLTREKIKTQSSGAARVLGGGIGYVHIAQFTERTGEEFFEALRRLSEENAASLIIDLRNNPGGVLEAAVIVAEPFFKKGELIVYTQGRVPADREEFRGESDDNPIGAPVVVLINQHSASAAEIVAGALKDAGRAVIVGERSFGKGSVQSVFTLRNGDGMRLTTARYHTSSGEAIHEHGVSPQIEVVLTPEEDHNIALQLARPELAGDPAAFKQRFETDPVPDRQLQTAISVLQGVMTLERREPRPAADPDAPAQPDEKPGAKK
jgi:carboxyl-terminal processing protease